MYRFSICIPITKVAYLKQTIDSVMSQSFTSFEILFQNNASNEHERLKIRSICNKFISCNHIRYFENKEQLSISDNFNLIVSRSNGVYISILSDDDIIAPDYLLNFDNLISKYPEVSLFHCRVRLINESGNTIAYSPNCPEFENVADFVFNRLSGYRMQYLSDFVFSKAKLIEVGGFKAMPFGWGLDDLTWYSLCNEGVAYTNYFGLDYRVSTLNFSYGKMNKESNLLKLQDIRLLFFEIEKLVNTAHFKKQSSYSKSIFENVIENAREKTNIELYKIICKNSGFIPAFFFYLQTRKEFNVSKKTIFYIISTKIKKHLV